VNAAGSCGYEWTTVAALTGMPGGALGAADAADSVFAAGAGWS
jgi:hypothetical protein